MEVKSSGKTRNPFWDFSVIRYAKPAVQELCLQLQKQAYANVNIVLFTQWLASVERVYENDIVVRNADLLCWHEQVIVPLRQARSGIKRAGQDVPGETLYLVVKKAELDAERIEQDMLFALSRQFRTVKGGPSVSVLAQQNLQAYLQTLMLTARQVGCLSNQMADEVFQ